MRPIDDVAKPQATSPAQISEPGLRLLADHLNAILQLGDDLTASICPACGEHGRVGDAEPCADGRIASLTRFVAQLRRTELAIIARILQARRRSEELPPADPVTRPLVRLFFSGTSALTDWAAAECRRGEPALDANVLPVAFLRSRGLIAPEAAAPDPYCDIEIGPDFLLCGLVPLGQLLDLVEAMLDALDSRLGLFTPPARRPSRQAS